MKRTANPGPAASPASAKQLDRDPDSVSLASASSISSVSSGGSGMGSLAFLNIRKRMGSTKSTASASSATSGGSYGAVSSNSNGALKSLFVKQAGLTVSTNQAGSASPSRKYAGSVNNTGSGTGTPTVIAMRAASFAEFRMADTRQQRQRRCLYALQKLETRFKVEGISVGVSSTLAPGVARKPYREPKFKDDKRLGLGKLSNLLQKKRRKKSRTEVFHLINLAIIDQSIPYALALLEDLSSSALRKKFPLHANKVFYSAMGQSMEPVCIAMFEKGFPLSVNSPIVIKGSGNLWKYVARETGTGKVVNKFKRISVTVAPNGDKTKSAATKDGKGNQAVAGGIEELPSIQLPSYFLSAVGLGLENVVRAMVKRADVNQNWHGLTSLHIAACKNLIGLTQFLLDSGADPSIGILVSQYALLRKLKSISSVPGFINGNVSAQLSSFPQLGNPGNPASTAPAPALVISNPSRPTSTHSKPMPLLENVIEPSLSSDFMPSTSQNPSNKLNVTTSAGALNGPPIATANANLPGASRTRSASPSSTVRHNGPERSRASSLSAATGISFSGPSISNSVKRGASSASGSIKNGQDGLRRRDQVRLTGCVAYTQPGHDAEKGLFNQTDIKRRSSVFHMWQDEFMKDKVIFAVELAAACGNWDVTRLILARMDQKVLARCSFALLVQRDVDLSMLFIRAGVPITQRDAYGSNALHLACRAGDLDLVTAYVETNKFDLNAKGQNDWAPLHEAIGMRRFEVSKYLVHVGASLESPNNMGETPRALGSRLGLSKAELDDALSATTPTTATSFQDSNNTASPDSAGPPSPQKSHHAVIASMEKSSSGSIGRLNILDKIIRPKSGSTLAQNHTDGNRQSSSLDSIPSLATIAHSNKAAAAAAQAAQAEAAMPTPLPPTEMAKSDGGRPAKSDVDIFVEK